MSEQFNFTVKDEKVDRVRAIQRHLEHHNISFSGYLTDALIDNFENGKWSKFFKEVKKT